MAKTQDKPNASAARQFVPKAGPASGHRKGSKGSGSGLANGNRQPLFAAIKADKQAAADELQQEHERKETARRRLAANNTSLVLNLRMLQASPAALEIAEIMLDKYTSAIPVRQDGKMKFWLTLAEERTRATYSQANPATVNHAVRAVKQELTAQLDLIPRED
jgi:hypothetical protein